MKVLVTGAAGFIGSHLCEKLIKDGHRVIGLDAFIPYYPRAIKERNLENLKNHTNFEFYEWDLRTADLSEVVKGVDFICHQAAMAGLMKSWSEFELYMSCNLLGTQRLLEAAKNSKIKKFIHISTSSVYGRVATGDENSKPRPISPYGITKLAAEHLCLAYYENFGLPVTILRYFSIYGPRQRPDMAYHIFIKSLLLDEPIYVYGDGNQSRGNTYIDDCLDGTLLAFEKGRVGEIYNIGGGEEVSVNEVLDILQGLMGKQARIEYKASRPGDQQRTLANIEKAKRELGFTPQVSIVEGLKKQVAWEKSIY